MPKTLQQLIPAGQSPQTWYYNNIKGSRINRNGEIAKWKTDLFFANPKTRRAERRTPNQPARS